MFLQSKLAMLHCEKLNSMSPGPIFVGTEPACAEGLWVPRSRLRFEGQVRGSDRGDSDI